MAALAHPLTSEQLAGVLGGSFGWSRRSGRPDTAAVAAELGVSRATVNRWLRKDRAGQSSFPAARLDELLRVGRPDPRALRQEQIDLVRARQALANMKRRPRRAVLPEWHERGWLFGHYVAVVAHPQLGLRGLVSPRAEDELLRRASAGGVVQQRVTVSSRFNARLVVDAALGEVDRWRFVPKSMPRGELRRTWMWLDGVDVDLVDVAARVGVKVTDVMRHAAAGE